MNDLTPDIGQGGVLGAIATAITLALTIGYKAYRKITEDKTGDRQVARQEDFVEDLMKANERLTTRLEILEKRADGFASERNTALVQASSLQGKIDGLEGRLTDLTAAKDAARKLVEQLSKQVDKLREENVALRKHVEVLEEIIRKGGGGTPPRPEMSVPLTWKDDDEA
jgi:chromosome segregation ATPase